MSEIYSGEDYTKLKENYCKIVFDEIESYKTKIEDLKLKIEYREESLNQHSKHLEDLINTKSDDAWISELTNAISGVDVKIKYHQEILDMYNKKRSKFAELQNNQQIPEIMAIIMSEENIIYNDLLRSKRWDESHINDYNTKIHSHNSTIQVLRILYQQLESDNDAVFARAQAELMKLYGVEELNKRNKEIMEIPEEKDKNIELLKAKNQTIEDEIKDLVKYQFEREKLIVDLRGKISDYDKQLSELNTKEEKLQNECNEMRRKVEESRKQIDSEKGFYSSNLQEYDAKRIQELRKDSEAYKKNLSAYEIEALLLKQQQENNALCIATDKKDRKIRMIKLKESEKTFEKAIKDEDPEKVHEIIALQITTLQTELSNFQRKINKSSLSQYINIAL